MQIEILIDEQGGRNDHLFPRVFLSIALETFGHNLVLMR